MREIASRGQTHHVGGKAPWLSLGRCRLFLNDNPLTPPAHPLPQYDLTDIMATSFTCPCEGICRWQQTKGVRTGWDALGPVARNLSRFRRKSAKIESAGELAGSAQGGCVTCLLVCRAIATLVPLESVSTVHLELSNFVGQLKVIAELLGGDGKARQEFYIYHPEGTLLESRSDPWWKLTSMIGYKGYEPFGPGSLRAPEQPRTEPFAYNVDAVICNTHFFIRNCGSHGCGHGGYTPTRLLSVSHRSQDGSDDRIRLIEPWPAFSSPFAALSHCWGQSRPAVTTKANYASRQSGTRLSDLPRTFQDAVWVCRRLGIGYIWIDSLCIIQDDAEDWDREATNMYRIYGAAYVTLAAAHGADGDAGLFPPAAEGQITPLDLRMERPEDGEATTVGVNIMAVPRLGKNSQVHKAYSTDEVSPSDADVLQTRGWALQERALSNRVVHFNAQELVYECRRLGLGCDCGGVWTRESFITQMMGSLYYRRSEAEGDTDSDDMSIDGSDDESPVKGRHPRVLDEVESNAIWAGNVKTFTTKALTKPNDRLSAFAGIAQTFQQLVDDDEDEEIFRDTGAYCAGLWEKSLPGGLMWSCATEDIFSLEPNSGVPGSTRIENAHAPTWSWCSVTGPCTLYAMEKAMNEKDMHVDDRISQDIVIDFAFESTTGSPFGRLSKAELSLRRVSLCKASRVSVDDTFVLLSREDELLGAASKISIAFDDPDEAESTRDIFLLPLWIGYHEWLLAKPWDPTACSTDEEMEAYYEEHFPPINPNERCKDHRFGVALVPASLQPGRGVVEGAGNRYQRLGIFHMRGPFCAEMDIRGGMWFAKTEPVPSGFTDEVTKSLRSEASIILV
jgi:hypothetical protein